MTMVTDVHDAYFKYVATLWNNNDLRIYGENMAYILRFMDKIPASYTFFLARLLVGRAIVSTELNPAGADFYRDMRTNLQAAFNASIDAAIVNMRTTTIADLEMQTKSLIVAGWRRDLVQQNCRTLTEQWLMLSLLFQPNSLSDGHGTCCVS